MNPTPNPIHSSQALPHQAMNALLRPQFCGHTVVDVFFGSETTLLIFENGTVLEVGAWVLSPPAPAAAA